jgi:hypothetical protein
VAPSAAGAHAGHQHGDHAGQAPGGRRTLTVAVYGAETPEAVPDEMAYFLFLRALAGATSRLDVLDGVLTEAGLAPADRAAVAAELEPLAVAMAARRQSPPGQAGADPGARVREWEAGDATRVRVRGALSLIGRTQLDSYVRTRVKSRIVRYSGPMSEGQR